jgi:hypothetical protein
MKDTRQCVLRARYSFVLSRCFLLFAMLLALTGHLVRTLGSDEHHSEHVRCQRCEQITINSAPRSIPTQACSYFFDPDKFRDAACNITLAIKYSAEAAQAGGCVPSDALERNCKKPTKLTAHTWFMELDFGNEDGMKRLSLFLRAWMLTQDLRRSQLTVWASFSPASAMYNVTHPPPWIHQFSPYISLRMFDYEREIATTPLSLSRHFESWARFDNHTHGNLPLQSDLVRNVLLFNYGGLWLDTDSVPLRDLWDLTVGLGLQFVPKFHNFIANNHIMYVSCPRSALARRRLEHISLFPQEFPEAWPRTPSAGGSGWIFNDALSEYVRASQAVKYNLSRDAEGIDARSLPLNAWSDIEVPFPMNWFDTWWPCGGARARNNSDFLRMTACKGTYIWHRLTKYKKGDAHELGPNTGADEFWDEIYDSTQEHDYKRIRAQWPEDPIVLTGGVECG